MVPELNKWQRIVALGLAAVIAVVTYAQFDSRDVEGVEWLLPVLVVGGLLLLAAHRSTAPKPSPSGADFTAPALPGDATAADIEWTRLSSFAARIHEASSPIKIPEQQAQFDLNDPVSRARLHEIRRWGAIFFRVTALGCAYGASYYRPRRKPPVGPTSAQFKAFRARVKQEMTSLIEEMDRHGSEPEIGPAEAAEKQLAHADALRVRAEAEVNLVVLATPMIADRSDLNAEQKRAVLMSVHGVIRDEIEQTSVIPSLAKLADFDRLAATVKAKT